MIKNKDIHNGLEKSEIRDFLSEGLLTILRLELDNKKEVVLSNGKYDLDYHIREAQANLNYWKTNLQLLHNKAAILSLIEQSNWEEHDVSDETLLDGNDFYMSFIGTKEEYETFIKNNQSQ